MIKAATFDKAKSLLDANNLILKIGNSVLISRMPKPTRPRRPATAIMVAGIPGNFENPNMNADMERR